MKYLVCIIFLIFPLLVNAGTWTGWGNITGVYVDLQTSSPRIFFKHSEAMAVTCTNVSKQSYYQLKMDSDYSNQAYSLLLAKEATKGDVRVHVKECNSDGVALVNVVDGAK